MTNLANPFAKAAVGAVSRLFPTYSARRLERRFYYVRKAQPKDWERAIPEPDRVLRLDAGLAVRSWGQGRKVLMVPGWEGRHSQFAQLVPALVNAGFQAVALDPPGHGLSEGRHADPFLFGEAVGVAAKALGPFHGAIGHSLGGIALMFALERGVHLNRVVLVATPSSIPDLLKDICGSIGFGRAATDSFIEAIDRSAGMSADHFVASRLCARRTEPVMIAHCKDDLQVPFRHSREIAAAWPGSRALSTKGNGHNRILHDEAVVEGIVDFLISYGR